MSMCGYHLRCLNNKQNCSNCVYLCRDKKEDYLIDALNVYAKSKEAIRTFEEHILQKSIRDYNTNASV